MKSVVLTDEFTQEEYLGDIKTNKYYPNFKQSSVILLSAMGASFLQGKIFKAVMEQPNIKDLFTITTVNTLLIFLVVYMWVKPKTKLKISKFYSTEKFTFAFIFPLVSVMIGVMMLNFVLNSFLQGDNNDIYSKFMHYIAKDKAYLTLFIIPIAVLAPITEEFIFRGYILRGLSSHHSPLKAIFLSSLLFSLFHLNLKQIPNAFILGIIFSVIMIHTRNILYPILYHGINNFMVVLVLFKVNPDSLTTNKTYSYSLSLLSIVALLGILFIYIGLKSVIRVTAGESRSIIPSKRVYKKYLVYLKDEDEKDL